MSIFYRWTFFCMLAVSLAACTEKPKEKTEIAPPYDHVWNAQTRALEKAQAVEQQTLDAAAAKEREIDQQSR